MFTIKSPGGMRNCWLQQKLLPSWWIASAHELLPTLRYHSENIFSYNAETLILLHLEIAIARQIISNEKRHKTFSALANQLVGECIIWLLRRTLCNRWLEMDWCQLWFWEMSAPTCSGASLFLLLACKGTIDERYKIICTSWIWFYCVTFRRKIFAVGPRLSICNCATKTLV